MIFNIISTLDSYFLELVFGQAILLQSQLTCPKLAGPLSWAILCSLPIRRLLVYANWFFLNQ